MMQPPKPLQHLTYNKIFVHKQAPYAIYRHQVDGEHCNNVHDHDFFELVLILGGNGIQITPYGNMPIESGSLFVLQPGIWHGYIDCVGLLVSVCAIDARVFDVELAWLRDNPLFSDLMWTSAFKPNDSDYRIHRLRQSEMVRCNKAFFTLQEIESKATLQGRVQQIGSLTTFLADIAESMASPDHGSTLNPAAAIASPIIEKTLLLFSQNIAKNWSIRELSYGFGLTTPYYIRLFKRQMGESPLSYLSNMRARRAAQLLLHSETSINQIALDIGWNDPGYFSRRFRHYFGVSPREYRQKHLDFSHT
ncbi:MAG: AraC family transcriptional regulator [Chloroflexi bacterium]|nr:AraC family transcriptional regulator [Chloroflexota bacterium]MCC6891633.1 helix-turn-helix domain-containing protein [Anaerolineae bacterium]